MRLVILLFVLLPVFSSAQKLPAIEDKTKNLKAYPGFMNFYWDESAGKIWLEIGKFDTEILYQTSLPAGLGSNDIGLDRGILGQTAIVKFKRIGNKIMVVQPNYDYRAITNDPAEKKAVEESFASSTIWGFVAEAETNGTVLIDATSFLLRDAMQVSNRLQSGKQGTYNIDLTRSSVYLDRTKNFPSNTEIESSITFTTKDARPGAFVSSVTPTNEALTLRMHHSFIQAPDGNYKPRRFDARSGYIPISYFDYSTPVTEPINKMFIMRHRLEKKDPNASVSEAVKPIVYYLDNGTPEPIRSALLEGARWWNQAFEAAGYKDAFQVKILPADADPMDIRYNMINWVHRSTRGWSYGAAVVDPRTGEIIKGNVTLGSLRVRHDYLIAQGLLGAQEAISDKDNKMLQMALQRLKQLSAHEIGHTIGLMHNYIASTQGRASVMDYPAPDAMINNKGEIDLSDAYSNQIGDWDKVSITYGYAQFAPGSNEQAELNKILDDATKKGLTFISDRDARDQGGMHPAAHLWDVNKDVVSGFEKVRKIREKALANFGINNIRKETPMALLEEVLVPVYLFHRYQLESVVKIVGGMEYSYATKGDGQLTTRHIPKEKQREALNVVLSSLDPKFLEIPPEIIKLIPPRPAGYEYNKELFSRKTGLLFDPLAAAESAADISLQLLFNPARMNRLAQSDEINGLTLDEMLNALIAKTWKSNAALTGLSRMISEQNKQLVLSYLLAQSMNNDLSFASQASLLRVIEDLRLMNEKQLASGGTNKGSILLTLERIKNRKDARPYTPASIPPGAPIGCE